MPNNFKSHPNECILGSLRGVLRAEVAQEASWMGTVCSCNEGSAISLCYLCVNSFLQEHLFPRAGTTCSVGSQIG